jgi:hypothetical protein
LTASASADIGRPHPRWGETPVAVVALQEATGSLPAEELRAWAAERLASYKITRAVEVVEALPRNAAVVNHDLGTLPGGAGPCGQSRTASAPRR